MLRTLLATAFLISFFTDALGQCPGPSCRRFGTIKEAVPGPLGGGVGVTNGYVNAPPSGGGGYGAAPPGGGYVAPPVAGGYGVPQQGGGYGVPQGAPGSGYGNAPAYPSPPVGNGGGIVYQNVPSPSTCVTPYGACVTPQPAGTNCICSDGVNLYQGVAE